MGLSLEVTEAEVVLESSRVDDMPGFCQAQKHNESPRFVGKFTIMASLDSRKVNPNHLPKHNGCHWCGARRRLPRHSRQHCHRADEQAFGRAIGQMNKLLEEEYEVKMTGCISLERGDADTTAPLGADPSAP
eukprot:3292967-Amphidinium_carterae.3